MSRPLLTPMVLLLFGLSACTEDKDLETGTDDSAAPADADGDGYTAEEDCDDTDAMTNPGVDESCDGLDNNCNDEIDEGLNSDWYADVDGDGFGDAADMASTCWRPDGYVPNDTDCDDTDPYVFPGQEEICDGIDNDCNGDIDDGATEGETEIWYEDADGDGYGDPETELEACGTPDGYVLDGTDCDDAEASTHPDADELCNEVDDDCDAEVDEGAVDMGTWYADDDRDGFGDGSTGQSSCDQPSGWVEDGQDCDDSYDGSFPGADEVCDERDNDCDGEVDDDAVDAGDWYADADGDAYGDETEVTTSCEAPAGSVARGGDCDDDDEDINPDASERCNDLDDDCDGDVDEDATDASTWYADTDGDAYGDASATTRSCDAPSGYVSVSTDCDDSYSGTHPGASEYCDDEDNDCDGSTDEGAVDRTTWYKDVDGDDYGDSATSKKACDEPSGYVSNKTDCDDSDAEINPDAEEICNEVDDDCDGEVDNGADDGEVWYADTDGDGWGTSSSTTTSCSEPDGYVASSGDCDDREDATYPGATEYCDDEDNDCDGVVDDSPSDGTTYYADDDSDTYGSSTDTTKACEKPTGYVTNKRDCDDTDGDVHPGADEYCDDEDDDCDGTIDESAVDRTTWYIDGDSDGYGDAGTKSKACDAPSGYVNNDDDCDDDESTVYPGADELCDDMDNDCDGTVDESPVDMTTWYKDGDRDGWGDDGKSTTSCDAPSGYVDDGGDCDDGDDDIHPMADEICEDDIDQDCDDIDAPCGLSGDEDLGDADARLIGEARYDYSSSSLASAGDVDADGYDDIIVGAYGDDTTASYAGAAYIVLGMVSGDLDLSDADAKLRGEGSNAKAGYAVAGSGDVDGDGYDDVIIGAIGDGTGGSTAGASYLVHGPITTDMALSAADAKVYGASANDNMGFSLSGAGDLDSDGKMDLLLPAYQADHGGTSSGAVYIFYGDVSGSKSASSADGRLVGETTYDFAGWSIDGGVDIDGDGVPDIAVGANGEDSGGTSAGAAYLVLGPASGTLDLSAADAKITGETGGDYLGTSVALVGDVNYDGYGDYFAGAYGYDVGTASELGAAYLFEGPLSGTVDASTADYVLTGESTGDRAGYALSAAGDVDKDLYDDLLVGAYRFDDGSTTDVGAAYLLMGPLSGSSDLGVAQARLIGENSGDYVGADVSPGGDVNADGFADLLLGAWKNDTGASDAGIGYLLYGGAAR